ncbi:hypothetical protein M409DRAFT_67274 [Zasmidium cellare ATCC 36951]|uniref:Pentatricopeptide repeat domain-containing protein n=1 Tax=Zasmidium cellare ATCC 36951 TaxID=1080233 RepID=A0A6A6CJ59_ZASCE|nr:uncharacterized protein M409DRAFT_67274 [Zasmidium cellare ATCC 36951]KAF2165456.1 hypothetical protein M409DRAFT_67274 [Zasmidium cellare ATCC 36951]
MSLNSGATLLDEKTAPEEAFKALWHQTNVASPRRLGQLVVDRPEHRTNMKLWVELLEYRQRIDGFAGIEDVWKGMRFREVDLPLSGDEADILWTTLLHACITSGPGDSARELRDSVLDHAKNLYRRHGAVWPKLYACIVGRCLRLKPHLAWVFHHRLANEWDMSSFALTDLVDDCIASLRLGDARRAFGNIHKASGRRDLYDFFLPELCRHLAEHEALRWHQDFIKLGDGPSSEVFALPHIQRLFELDKNKSLPMLHHRSRADSFVPVQPGHHNQPLTRANMSALVGEVHGIKPKEVSDTFVAKLFATRAFPLNLVIKGLSFFGLDRLGPLALHEMASKAETYAEFCNGLSELKSMGIAVNTSTYGRLIEEVAIEGRSDLFQVLMASDQHPEAFDEPQTQELLLVSFLERGDMLSAHLTLLALSLNGQAQHSRAWNRILQHYIMERDYRAVDKTMRHMQDSKMPPTVFTLSIMNRHLLPRRDPGKAPYKPRREEAILRPLQFTTNAYMFAARNKVHVRPTLWKELLKRYAMDFRFDECERLVHWLLSWYGRNKSSLTREGRRDHYFGMKMLETIFPPMMQQALIHWGVRCAGHSGLLRRDASSSTQPASGHHDECQPWARGLLLVRILNKFGMQVSLRDIRRALTIRLLPLFGPAFSCKRINEEARLRNRLTLADYIKHANEICDVNLFSVDPTLLSEERPNPSKLMVAIFSDRRRIGQKSKDYADIAEYTQALERGYRLPAGARDSQRRQLWRYSPFRLILGHNLDLVLLARDGLAKGHIRGNNANPRIVHNVRILQIKLLVTRPTRARLRGRRLNPHFQHPRRSNLVLSRRFPAILPPIRNRVIRNQLQRPLHFLRIRHQIPIPKHDRGAIVARIMKRRQGKDISIEKRPTDREGQFAVLGQFEQPCNTGAVQVDAGFFVGGVGCYGA